MNDVTTRLGWLLGNENLERLGEKSVLLFGCGGVGSFAMESLVRSGIGRLVIVDGDVVDITNMNRQLIATYDTVGMRKVLAAKERCHAINKDVQIEVYDRVYTKAVYPDFIASLQVDYIIDAIDMVTAKIDIISEAKRLGIPVISSMGMGNKIDPTQIRLADITKTTTCSLARVMRRELKKRRISKVPVMYSLEKAREPQRDPALKSPGSCSFVPSVAGLMMTSYVIRDLLDML